MTAVQQIAKLNKIKKSEFENLNNLLFDSFLGKAGQNNILISQQEELINLFSAFLEKYLEMGFSGSKSDKLEIINFLDKLNMQKELLELSKESLKIEELKNAAISLGNKSQSAFELKPGISY